MLTERVVELAPTMGAKDALIGVGILAEKMQLLDGEATSRMEITRPEASPVEEFERYLQAIPEATVEEIGFGGEKVDAKAPGDQPGESSAG